MNYSQQNRKYSEFNNSDFIFSNVFFFLIVSFSIIFLVVGCQSGDGSSSKTQTSCVEASSSTSTLDPNYSNLVNHQWHLKNISQKAFASSCGTSGEDINQETTYNAGNKGNGITVAVVDTGLEIAHVDLNHNVVLNGSWDFVSNDSDPTNTIDDKGDHGTSVAGLIAAEDNTIGGRGVAPKASLKGFNFLKNQLLENHLASLGGDTTSDDVDIFNMSYGTGTNEDLKIDTLLEAQFKYGVDSLRNDKGAIYVKSAGNGFDSYAYDKIGDEYIFADCTKAYQRGISCQNANMDPKNTLPWVITVGALAADGARTSYSTGGSAIWISAPGGESGCHKDTCKASFAEGYEPAMITTDQSGCDRGYTYGNYFYNYFEENWNNLNYNCDFTSTFNGTSSAAPVVSGAIALILNENSDLSWRDVKHILAKTARKVDSTQSGVSVALGNSIYKANLGWTTNDASFDFHNWYGFGAVDVDAAVALAKPPFTINLGDLTSDSVDSGAISVLIPDNSADGATSTLGFTTDLVIENVQVSVDISHDHCGDLGIELKSARGTDSILFTIFNGFADTDDLSGMVLSTNAFYGESSLGDWKIKVVDADDTSSDIPGLLNNWKIKIYGHAP